MGYDPVFLGTPGVPGYKLTVDINGNIVGVAPSGNGSGETSTISLTPFVKGEPTPPSEPPPSEPPDDKIEVYTEPATPIYPPVCLLPDVTFHPFTILAFYEDMQPAKTGGIVTGYTNECGGTIAIFKIRLDNGILSVSGEDFITVTFDLGYRLEGSVFIAVDVLQGTIRCRLWNGLGDTFDQTKTQIHNHVKFTQEDIYAISVADGKGFAVEIELVSPVPTDDYTLTTKEFYINPPEVMDAEYSVLVESSVIDLVSDQVTLELIGLHVYDSYHETESDEPRLTSGSFVSVYDSYHDLTSKPVIQVVQPASSLHELWSDDPILTELPIINLGGDVIELFSTDVGLSTEDQIAPYDSFIEQYAAEVAAGDIQEVLQGVEDGRQRMFADELPLMSINYKAYVYNASHDLTSSLVKLPFLRVNDAIMPQVADVVWGFVDSSLHRMYSDTIKLPTIVRPRNSEHLLSSDMITINKQLQVDNGIHYFHSSYILQTNNSYHELIDNGVVGNSGYKRVA